ncbi:hypothetical protein B0O99DRAFT_599161 [Bisporella sp. PMI_857]|nr:hypothetical protein B0O99DRAFT_599161 [Bisporella sp. PMI_857]
MESVLGHSKACCNIPPVISKGYGEKGKYETIGGLKTYVTGSRSSKKAILVIYDIFGFFPQTLQGADILASSPEGYQIFMPDFFEGAPASIDWYPPVTDDQRPHYIEGVYGAKVWGVVGYCWGGKVVSLTSGKGTRWKAAAQAHPARMDIMDAEIVIPTCVLASEEEGEEMVNPWAEKLTVEKHVERFGDQLHGFLSARADLEDGKVRGEYERGYNIFLDWFAKHL